MTFTNRLVFLPICAVLFLSPAPGFAQDWNLVKPSTTGLPGDEVRLVRFAPDDLLWVGARWVFWTQGGFGVYHRGRNLWTTYSNADGTFPSTFANDMAWSPDGTLWVATDDGLVHWNHGVRAVYTTANAPLLHDRIEDVDVDADGHVWLNNTEPTTTRAAIFEFDGTSWRSFAVGAQLPWAAPWNNLTDVIVDHLGHVWVANSVLNGVAEFDGANWRLHGASVDRFGAIREDKAGNIWLRAGVGGTNSFWKFDRATFTRFPVATTPTAIGIDDDGAVFLADWGGTIRKTTNGGASFTVWATGLNKPLNVEPDPRGTEVWVGTIGALGRFSAEGALLDDFNSFNTGSPDFFVDRFDVDRAGNVWLATGEGGLSRFDGLQWRNWGNHNIGSEPYPFAGNEPMGGYYEDSNGTGWMGGNGIARWQPATGTFHGFWDWRNNPGMAPTLFTHFAEDAQGRLFVASKYGEVFRFNGSLWVREPIRPYVGSVDLPGMEADSRGDIWLADWFDVWHWDGVGWSKIAQPTSTYFFDLGGINAMAIGPDDVMWLGTNRGLVRWDGAEFRLYDVKNSPLPAAQVAGVDVRADGVLGLASLEFGPLTPFPNGVAIVAGDIDDPASWSTWSYGSSPLPHYQLGRVEFDAEGNLWVSTISEGVAVLLNPAQPLAKDRPTLAASDGGTVEFRLDGGTASAGQVYALLGTLSGTTPGISLPGVTLPLNLDVFSSLTLALPGFVGALNGAGRATATLRVPPVPSAAGVSAHFAFALPTSWSLVSNAVAVRFSP